MNIPDWVVYPESDWLTTTPEAAGFWQPEFDDATRSYEPAPTTFWGERHGLQDFAAVLTRGGYLVKSWGRTKDYKHQTASVGKAFTWALLGLAVEKLRLNADEPVYCTWTGVGEFSHAHKYLDNEQHRDITWRHLAEHTAGFAVESGYNWRTGEIPDLPWIQQKWTGNPTYDMYALRAPGEQYYSSAGYVRLGQALTALWGMDIKKVLDQELLSKIGIKAENWHWMALEKVYAAYDIYPATPGYGHYVDPPFHIRGSIVRGGPGWVCMSAEDLARFGLLIATGGVWKGEQLLSSEWLISKSGGNESTVIGDRRYFISGSRVATTGLPDFLWVPDFQEYQFPDHLIDPLVVPARSSR
jgi:CubicO group peptidase (beta-lactamase class C family)